MLEEREYINACAKKEIAFYACLLNDWKREEQITADMIIDWFKFRGLEATNADEWVDREGVEHKQIDFLGSFCGFTLLYGNNIEIGYVWAFDGCSTELKIDKQGKVRVL